MQRLQYSSTFRTAIQLFFIRTNNLIKESTSEAKTSSLLANNREIKTPIVLPYAPRYFEALSKILRNVEILVCSKPHLTLKNILSKAKDSVERSSRPGVVY